ARLGISLIPSTCEAGSLFDPSAEGHGAWDFGDVLPSLTVGALMRIGALSVSEGSMSEVPRTDSKRKSRSGIGPLRLLNFCALFVDLRGFAFGDLAGDFRYPDVPGDSEEAQNLQRDPGRIEFVPGQAVAGRGRMRMVVVVPAFTERDHGDPPV